MSRAPGSAVPGAAGRVDPPTRTSRLLYWSADEAATLSFGRTLGHSLRAPAWIGLSGDLGAGKTVLVRGIARGLGFSGKVRSPSYVLEHRYAGRVPIRHLDLYRIERPGEDLAAEWDESAADAVVLVEWAERVPDPPEGGLWVRIEPGPHEGRRLELTWDPERHPFRDLRLERLFDPAEPA